MPLLVRQRYHTRAGTNHGGQLGSATLLTTGNGRSTSTLSPGSGSAPQPLLLSVARTRRADPHLFIANQRPVRRLVTFGFNSSLLVPKPHARGVRQRLVVERGPIGMTILRYVDGHS